MQEQKQSKVTLIDNQTETNKQFNSNKIITEVIEGRTFVFEEPSALEYSDYSDAVEYPEKNIFSFTKNSALTYIKSIDGVEFKKPQTKSEIRMGISRLGKRRVLDKIFNLLVESGLMVTDQDSEESKEVLKK